MTASTSAYTLASSSASTSKSSPRKVTRVEQNATSSAASVTSPSRTNSSINHSATAATSSWGASIPRLVSAAIVGVVALGVQSVAAGAANNVTSLEGTWSTGAGHVTTGLSFFNPVNLTFSWPTTAGRSYSFTDSGYWEEALYLYESTPGKPNCVAAQLIWQHGTYVLHSNNSLTLTPFGADGRQSIADRCASTSTNNSYYYQEETMQGFDITLSTHYGQSAYALQLYAYDGSLLPMMYQTYNPPQMLPTTSLHETIYGQTA